MDLDVEGNPKIMRRIFVILFIFLFSYSSLAWGDVIYEEETTGAAPEAKLQKRVVVHLKGQMRKEEIFIPPRGGQVVIIRFNKDWVWIGDKSTKTSTEGAWEEMSGRLLLDWPPPALEIKAAGEKKELLGYMAEKFLVKEENNGSVSQLEVYVAQDLPGSEEVNKFNAVFWQKMDLKSEYQASWRSKIKGFPLLVIKKVAGPAGQEKITTTRVTNFQEVLLDAREFEAPLVFK